MKKFLYVIIEDNYAQNIFTFCSLILIVSNFLYSIPFEDRKKIQMVQELEIIRHYFE